MDSVAASSIGKRSGAVQFEHFQTDDYQKQLEGVIDRVNGSLDGFKYDKRILSNTLAGLLQFMEDALGIKVRVFTLSYSWTQQHSETTVFRMQAPNKTFPKVPAKLFYDFSSDGPLSIIARLCATSMKAKGQKRIDWLSPATRKENTDLVLRIRQELLRAGFIRVPRVYVHPDCPNAALLRHTVTKMGGELGQSEDTPGITHIARPWGANGDPDDGKEYLRSLEVKGGAARVHWWYLPDSYDEWIPAAAAPSEIEPELKPPGGRPWKVYYRWIVDSEKYNEWMNETDYETEEAVAENKRAREAGEKAGEVNRERKKPKRDKVHGLEVAGGVIKSIAPGVVLRKVLAVHQRAMEGGKVEDISHGQRQEWCGMQEDSWKSPPNAVINNKVNNNMTNIHSHHLPPYASQLLVDPQSVHDREREELGEFFATTVNSDEDENKEMQKNEDYYKAIRNGLVSLYRENLYKPLSFTQALRWMDADANDVRKIFDFLVRWGVINLQPSSLPTITNANGCSDGETAVPDQGGFCPALGGEALMIVKKDPSPMEAVESAVGGGSLRLSIRQGTFSRAIPQPPAIATGRKYRCHAHPWEDCTELRYHCTKIPNVDLCTTAFDEGHFPPGCCAKDFVKVSFMDGVRDSSGWSDQETSLLLEALEIYGTDWAMVADHVGGKSPLQCVQRLLQLPIEDMLLLDSSSSKGPNGDSEGRKDLPFSEVGNPIMAYVAFLSTIIGPRVGASFAQGALESLAGIADQNEESEEADKGQGQQVSKGHREVEEEADLLDIMDGREGVESKYNSPDVVRAAIHSGLEVATERARALALVEEREMERLVLAACEAQIRRVHTKLNHLEKLDTILLETAAPEILERAAQYRAELDKLSQRNGVKDANEG
jgi:SWI/SNF related-matrix-associated actin-dependent regulator of chromatin subfamily C